MEAQSVGNFGIRLRLHEFLRQDVQRDRGRSYSGIAQVSCCRFIGTILIMNLCAYYSYWFEQLVQYDFQSIRKS